MIRNYEKPHFITHKTSLYHSSGLYECYVAFFFKSLATFYGVSTSSLGSKGNNKNEQNPVTSDLVPKSGFSFNLKCIVITQPYMKRLRFNLCFPFSFLNSVEAIFLPSAFSSTCPDSWLIIREVNYLITFQDLTM